MKKISNWINKRWGWFFTNGNKQPFIAEESYVQRDDMYNVSEALKFAKEDGLEVEVVTWALMYMKENPNLSISEAITMGFYEWDK